MKAARVLFLVAVCFAASLSGAWAQSPAPSPSASPSPSPSATPAVQSSPAPAAGATLPDDPSAMKALLKDSDETWRIGFAVLDTSDLSASLVGLSRSIPLAWKAAFYSGLSHTLSDEEKGATAQSVLESLHTRAGADLSQAVDDRDRAWFAGKLGPDQETAARAKIAAARKRLDLSVSFGPGDVAVKDSLPLALVSPDADRELFSSDKTLPGLAQEGSDTTLGDLASVSIAASQNLQVLVYGRLSSVQTYVHLEVFAYNSVLRRIVWQDSATVLPDAIGAQAQSLVEDMANAVLGYVGAGLKIAVDQGGATISLNRPDGTRVAASVDSAEFRFLAPGPYVLSIEKTGFEKVTDNVNLIPGQDLERGYTLDARELRFFTVASDPAGASVYLDSHYEGTTPATIPIPDSPTSLFLDLDGYQRYQMIVGPDTKISLDATLSRDLINWADEVTLQRRRFYDSLGFFALSLIPPIIFNGLYANIASAIPPKWDGRSDYATYVSKAKQGNLFYDLSLGTVFISAVVFLDSMLHLSSYLRAADTYAGRN